jgi:hypothetical protein
MIMGLKHAMRVLAEEWDAVLAEVPPERRPALLELVAELATEAVPADSVEIAEEIADLLGLALPPEHPFRRALAVPETRLAPTGTATDLAEWLGPTQTLRGRLRGSTPSSSSVEDRVRARLLSAPAFTEADLLASGQNPDDAGLIRLVRPDGTARWPAFQFGPDGRPYEVVRVVNELLDVAADPWGVADWWLGYHGGLRDAPERVLGSADPQGLIDLARLERSEG